MSEKSAQAALKSQFGDPTELVQAVRDAGLISLDGNYLRNEIWTDDNWRELNTILRKFGFVQIPDKHDEWLLSKPEEMFLNDYIKKMRDNKSAALESARFALKVKSSGLNYQQTFKTLEGHGKEINIVHEWIQNGQGHLFISGATGTGKTHLANAAGIEFVKLKKRVVFKTFIVFYREIFTGNANDIYKQIEYTDVLVLDNIGEPINKVTTEIFMVAFELSAMNGRPRIITTSLYNENEIQLSESETGDEALRSRLLGGATIIKTKGMDRRKTK